MKWESFDLHLENLFPGLVSFYLLLAVLPEATLRLFVEHRYPIGEYLSGGVFLAASYMIGAIA